LICLIGRRDESRRGKHECLRHSNSLRVFVIILIGSGLIRAAEIADAEMNQNSDAVRALLAKKVDVNAAQADGTTALHWAARWNDLETAKLLIAAANLPGRRITMAQLRCFWRRRTGTRR